MTHWKKVKNVSVKKDPVTSFIFVANWKKRYPTFLLELQCWNFVDHWLLHFSLCFMNYLKTWWVEKHGSKYDFDGNLKTIYCFSFFYEKISIRMFQFHDIYCENLEPSVLLHWVVWIFRNDFLSLLLLLLLTQ